MQDSLLSLLFELSQWLLAPIVVGLSGASVWLLFLVGTTIRTGVERLFFGRNWHRYVDRVRKRTASPQDWYVAACHPLHRWVVARSRAINDLPVFIREAEVMAHQRLGKLQILVRTGPMLGLVGTLIPLGPALQGLSDSDLSQLGIHMNIAFTMTVFGILVGAMAYGLFVINRIWSERDLSDLELIYSLYDIDNKSCPGAANESKNQALVA
jgi:biopolymer transport protein ExbB/TolQ